MFCAKCGTYTENGELCNRCAAEANGFIGGFSGHDTAIGYTAKKKSFALPFALKIVALALAIVAFALHFSNLISQRKSEVSESKYEDYRRDKEYEDDEDYYDGDSESQRRKEALKTEKYDIYDKDEADDGKIDHDRLMHANRFLQWAFLAFALFLGTFVASFFTKNEKVHLVCQGLFFGLMLCAFLFILFATFTGKAYYRTTIGYSDFSDDYIYLYYSSGVGITFTWILAFASSLAGLVLTALSAKKLNKE